MKNPTAKYPKLSHKPETKRKIAQSLKGHKKTEATKAKMRESRMRYLASLQTATE
jgi:hypothetical protein